MSRSERGTVTAEFAMVVPAIVLLLAFCLASMQVAVLQLRVQDAAAVAARVEARGQGGAAGYVTGLVPGATVTVSARGDLDCAVVSTGVSLVGIRLGALRVTGESCAPRGGPGGEASE